MRIGVLGGGQLGRMLALAGLPWGLEFRFFEPRPEAVRGIGECVVAHYGQVDALDAFCEDLDVCTYEFENVPLEAARYVSERVPLRPGLKALEIAQDRLLEKRFFASLGMATARYVEVSSPAEVPVEGLLKTRRLGYDGKGQWRLPAAYPGVPCLAEELVAFSREVALLACRSVAGEVRAWPLVETTQQDGVLVRAVAPAGEAPLGLARRILEALAYVGVLAVEFFEVDGQLIANEMAPRVHNSGHWTIEGAPTSQFENHLRAICGWPLGPTEPCRPSVMTNLLGEIPVLPPEPGVHLHVYGKAARAGRKVGHMTVVQ